MTQELGKYYLRFALFPKTLSNGDKVWLKRYYTVHLDLPVLDPVYTIKNISEEEYIVDTLKGIIDKGYHIGPDDLFERMLNAARLRNFGLKDVELD